MASDPSNFERLRAYDRRQASGYAGGSAPRQQMGAPRRARRPQDDANTMGPQEDVVERRLHRNRHHVNVAAGDANGSIAENLFLLLLLISSIYGLYRLTIYLLMQG